MPTPKPTLTRTIHPVGQGAFYSEVFTGEKEEPLFTVVYDCGGIGKEIAEKVENIPDVVDILFISHFHNDHINGVPTLLDKKKVKKIVFPLISPCRFIVDYIRNCTRDAVEDACVVMIKLLQAMKDAIRDGSNGVVSIEGDIRCEAVNGDGRSHNYPSESSLWEYLSFYKEDDEKERRIWGKIADKLKIPKTYADRYQDKEIYHDISDRLKENKDLLKEIKDIFSAAFQGDHNSYSMIVLSHERKEAKSKTDSKHFDCLYTGDINVKEETWVLSEVLERYKPNYIQVPHHGSNHNHDKELYKYHPIAFISVGLRNPYRHPGLITLTDIIDYCKVYHKEYHLVTESRSPFSDSKNI